MNMTLEAQQPFKAHQMLKQTSSSSFDESSLCSDLASTCASEPSISSSSNDPERLERLTFLRGPTASGFRKLHERSDADQIRARLLNKLGIEKEYPASMGVVTEASRVVQQGQEDAFNVALKADYGLPDRRLQSSESLASLATSPGVDCVLEKRSNRGVVCFDASVKVHPIPARSDYSQRMRSILWTPNMEIQQNAARNSLEFASEEWDVSKVVDDKDMVIYAGERVHPIHFVQECNLNQHICDAIADQRDEPN